MKKAVKHICQASPIYIHLKNHYCPNCGSKVKLGYVSKIVNSNSPEAKNYDFSLGDTFLVGDVEFRIKCFYCANCEKNISFKEMKDFEKK